MSYREAAENAYSVACADDPELAKFGLSLLSSLANRECYLARLSMMFLYDSGRVVQPDVALAKLWADKARAMHQSLTDPNDLYDAGLQCWWDRDRFMSTEQDAFELWEKAALLGSGVALYAICDVTRNRQEGTSEWTEKLTRAASLGSIEAMVELAQQKALRDTEQGLRWLRAAAVLGSLRAKEVLEWRPD